MNKILFVCSENAGRSQMAEAFFNARAKEIGLDWSAESAGTAPAKDINPDVAEAMSEIGSDISRSGPKQFYPERTNDFVKIISFGCIVKSALPENVRSKIEEWHIDDPRGKSLDEIREIRDEIKKRIEDLFGKL